MRKAEGLVVEFAEEVERDSLFNERKSSRSSKGLAVSSSFG